MKNKILSLKIIDLNDVVYTNHNDVMIRIDNNGLIR